MTRIYDLIHGSEKISRILTIPSLSLTFDRKFCDSNLTMYVVMTSRIK